MERSWELLLLARSRRILIRVWRLKSSSCATLPDVVGVSLFTCFCSTESMRSLSLLRSKGYLPRLFYHRFPIPLI